MGAKRKEITGECVYGKDGNSTRFLQDFLDTLYEIADSDKEYQRKATVVRRKTEAELAAERELQGA